MYEKKFGFSFRPATNGASNSPTKNKVHNSASEMIENYFYFSSMDSKESKLECPE